MVFTNVFFDHQNNQWSWFEVPNKRGFMGSSIVGEDFGLPWSCESLIAVGGTLLYRIYEFAKELFLGMYEGSEEDASPKITILPIDSDPHQESFYARMSSALQNCRSAFYSCFYAPQKDPMEAFQLKGILLLEADIKEFKNQIKEIETFVKSDESLYRISQEAWEDFKYRAQPFLDRITFEQQESLVWGKPYVPATPTIERMRDLQFERRKYLIILDNYQCFIKEYPRVKRAVQDALERKNDMKNNI